MNWIATRRGVPFGGKASDGTRMTVSEEFKSSRPEFTGLDMSKTPNTLK